MKNDHRTVVVGLGGIGSAAAYWLARRVGSEVLGLEQFELGHERGASQDHSRIIRRSYHTPGYVRLADQAYSAWAQVEAESGDQLVIRTGGLDLWPADPAIAMEDYTRSMRACGVGFEELDAGAVMRRWPQWRLSDDVRAVFQEDGGIAAAARGNAAHRRLAVEHGATLVPRARVTGIRDHGGEIHVDTDAGRRYRCQTLVLAADAWTNDLLAHFDVRLPLTITREQVQYFRAADPAAFAPERFPIWIWMDDPSFYGLPAFGEDGPKAAQDLGGRETTPETRSFDPDPEAQRRVEDFLSRYLPGAVGPVISTKTCLYTLTPDRDFVIDAVPGHPSVLMALGAAHAYKFASLIGRTLADLAVDGTTATDLQSFRADRAALTRPEAARTWLV